MYTENGKHIISNLGKDNKCHLWFDKRPNNVYNILTKFAKDNSRSGEITIGFKESTPTTVYSKADDNGTSYVFAGVNPNNWVKLGNLYFRIIRFNGNGSLRLIYSGEGNAETSGIGTQIGKKVFNESYDDNMYVGLQYTSGQVHGTETNSMILGEENSADTTTLYGWYNSKIKPNYASLIDTNAGFCSDREPYADEEGTMSGGGLGTTFTYYNGFVRIVGRKKLDVYKLIPELKCKNASDNLKLPVGLITADEYMVAGGSHNSSDSNSTLWLNTNENYWTMTPAGYYKILQEYSQVFSIRDIGAIIWAPTFNSFGVRPVINLKNSTIFLDNNATGTIDNPFVVKI